MATKHQRMQRAIHLYKEQTGKKEIDMKEVAKWAAAHGWELPRPENQLDRLAHEFSLAAREEVQRDAKTGHPYRVNHAVKLIRHGGQLTLWVDIDEAPRRRIHRSLQQRREQMIGDGFQLTLDADHWNRYHPTEKPIRIELDFHDDVEWRKNSPQEKAN